MSGRVAPCVSSSAIAIAVVAAAILLLAALSAAPAVAANTSHPLVGPFGPTEQPLLGRPAGMAVAPGGDLLAIDFSDNTLHRYKPDGEPDPFSALGSNVIDGKTGADATPQAGILEAFGSPAEAEVAVDASGGATAGDIYVTDSLHHVVDIFAPSGAWLGQLTNAGEETCGVAVDPAGDVYVASFGAGISKYVGSGATLTDADKTTTFAASGGSCGLAAGAGPTEGSLFATAFEGSVTQRDETTGAAGATVSTGSNTTVSVDSASGHVFVAKGAEVLELDASGATPTQVTSIALASAATGVAAHEGTVYVARSGEERVEEYGPPSSSASRPEATTEGTTGVGQTAATLHGTVDPKGVVTISCKFEWGPAAGTYTSGAEACSPDPGASGSALAVSAAATGLTPHATYHYRVVIETEGGGRGVGRDQSFVASQAPTAIAATAEDVEPHRATLRATVNPAGGAQTECRFRWGRSPGQFTVGSTACEPDPGSATTDVAVSAEASGLDANAHYYFEVVEATDGGTATSEGQFTTATTAPEVGGLAATSAAAEGGGADAAFSGTVNPNGEATTYRFEYLTEAAYQANLSAGHEGFAGATRVPEPDAAAGSGVTAVPVSRPIANLATATSYRFRLVATNGSGAAAGEGSLTTPGPGAALPDGRGWELTSIRPKGPVALSGLPTGLGTQVLTQAAPQGSGLLYPVAPSPEGGTSGEVEYLAARGSGGWSSSQLSPPTTEQVLRSNGGDQASYLEYVSPDFTCAVIASSQRLTADTPSATIEAGHNNLYLERQGQYTLITSLVPTNLGLPPSELGGYTVAGVSPDCETVVFETLLHYPGLGTSGIYRWHAGQLSDLGLVPGPSAESSVPAVIGAAPTGVAEGYRGAVSTDASSVIFTARSQVGGDTGQLAVFRRFGGSTVDVSESQTVGVGGPANNGASWYQLASADGRRVFFTARYGLAHNGTSTGASSCSIGTASTLEGTGCDLYEYDAQTGTLSDLTVDRNGADQAGASVLGVLGGSEDGSHVYFAAAGQLVAGRGNTEAENVTRSTYNLYFAHGGELAFVGVIDAATADQHADLANDGPGWSARVTPDGTRLLFLSHANVTGYESGGVSEAYLYEAGSETTRCLSCRLDGNPSLGNPNTVNQPLSSAEGAHDQLLPPASLSVDGRRVFFETKDPLSVGATAGQSNVYEWEEGQLHLLASGPPANGNQGLQFMTASSDGNDVYVMTPERLTWEDPDEGLLDVYDARVGGGFAEPPPPAPPCDATVEGACNPTSANPPASASPPTAGFSGPENPRPSKCHKGYVKRHGRCVKSKRHRKHAHHKKRKHHKGRHHQ